MRHLFLVITFLLASSAFAGAPGNIRLPSTPTASGTMNVYPRILPYGDRVWMPETDPVANRALGGLGGIWAFVQMTNTGFKLSDCEQDVRPRVCHGHVEATMFDGETPNAPKALYTMLKDMGYRWVAVSTSDTTTVEAMRPFATTIEPYNSDGSDGSFASAGEFSIVVLDFSKK
jgi:hypothetical protein